MKKRKLKSLTLNKQPISKLQAPTIKGGLSSICGDNTTTLITEWLGCGSYDNCNNTGSYHCPTSAAVCDHLCPDPNV